MLSSPSFSTARLRFRATEKSDAPFFHEMYSDEATMFAAMGNPPSPYGKGRSEAFVASVEKSLLNVIAFLPSRTLEEEEIAVGWACLSQRFPGSSHLNANFGLSLHPKHQGKGYGKEIMEWLLEMAFQRFNLHRIEGEVFSWNEPAIKIYKSCGFVQEGRRREAMYQEGEYRDDLIFGLLKHEWRAAHPEKLKPVQKTAEPEA
ncbi:hypothetical protein JCM6882_005542 [Rhodosporidiobolus microsporus]